MQNTLTTLCKVLSVSLLLSACGAGNNTHQNHETNEHSGHDHSQHDHSKHHHGPVELTSLGDNVIKPTIELDIQKDPMKGWNLHIQTQNYTFTPQKVNQDNIANEGHAHLYIDNYKIARIYSNWYHIVDLRPGEHTIRVTLNANDHSDFLFNGEEIAASVTVTQP